MAETKLSRKQREHLEHKQEILETALKLLEFSVGTLYNFFESKESLFSALIRSCAHRISDILVPILDEKTDEKQKIVNYIEAYKQIIQDHAPSIKLYLSQNFPSALTLRADVEPETDAIREVFQEKLSDIFKSGMRKGIFKGLDPWITTLSLSTILESFVFSVIKSPGQISVEDGISRIKELFFTGIAKSLSV
jgi:AcrR family transcriptional regulator